MIEIDLKTKLTSSNFEEIIKEYWALSFLHEKVIFNLSKFEWIAIEQITFLISWINKLSLSNIFVSLKMPDSIDINTLSDNYTLKRRQKCINYLISDWGIQSFFHEDVQLDFGEIKTTRSPRKEIPYYELETIPYYVDSFDLDFNELYETKFLKFLEYVNKRIKSNTFLNYFDNHFLHYSIIKEFYSNSCQHAYSSAQEEKCYLSLNSDNKIIALHGELLKEKLIERYSERPVEEQSFYKNENDEYSNTSYIEFCFFDYGIGIPLTLNEKYFNEDLKNLEKEFGQNHFEKNVDTRILEYSFLLFTSKYELGKDFEMHDYIPRGLYIIKDIIRRYQGMLIARSKKGKVIFNFKNNQNKKRHPEVIYRENDFDETIGDGFPGTSITIVLPAKESYPTGNQYQTNIENQKTKKPNFYFINLLEFTNKIISSNLIQNEKSEVQKRVKFYELFFSDISQQILSYKIGSSNLVFFDFAGIERANKDIFNKFLYFLAYCPLITDKISVCLFNVIEKGINQALVQNEKLKIRSKGFFIKPIPCIYPDQTINWIGIEDIELETIINDVWKEDYRKNVIYKDIHHLEGNFVKIINNKKGSFSFNLKIQSYHEIIDAIYQYHRSYIEKEINGEGIIFKELKNDDHDYNIVLSRKFEEVTKKQRAFLTANAKYQTEFLTFIEKLYLREYRRLISTYFLYNLFFEVKEEDIKKITKILTVTLSSQLLGKEFTDILNELNLTTKTTNLIPLSNYYDFQKEEFFNEISSIDTVIAINDVISTGNLSVQINKSIKEIKATIIRFVAIIDSRTEEEVKQTSDLKITALFQRPIPKYDTNPFPDTTAIWINPILNAPTTMSRSKSYKESILKTPQEFIKYFDNDDLFLIGYYKQNTVFHTYYLQTDLFLKNELKNGFPVITDILQTYKERITNEKNVALESDLIELKKIKEKLLKQSDIDNGIKGASKNKSLIKSFDHIEKQLISELINKNQLSLYDKESEQLIDFVFYPFLSSISEVEKNINPISLKLRGNHFVEVYPIPRIMTPKGWRFSFPPKFLNFHTVDKTALILDDGSCTGETLIQMIDTLSFLELREISVISIFGRLEDFQREFLTRIKQIKVKDTKNKDRGYKIIPINIFFGTHFHIPVYSRNTNPYSIEQYEITEIVEYYKIVKNDDSPNFLNEYIKTRLELISFPLSTKQASPFNDIPKSINKRLMFILRDLIGNYDSYRLFREDEQDFNDSQLLKIPNKNLRDIICIDEGKLALVAVLNHEPKLIDTVRRIYPELISSLVSFIQSFYSAEKLLSLDLEDIYFFSRSLSNLDLKSFFDEDFLNKSLERIDYLLTDKKEHISLNFIGYLFTAVLLKKKKNIDESLFSDIKILLQNIWLTINRNKQYDKRYANIIKYLYHESLLDTKDLQEDSEINIFLRVQKYYSGQTANISNDSTASHPNDYLKLTSFITTLQGNFKGTPSISAKVTLINDLQRFYEKLEKVLINDLKKVLEFLKTFYIKHDLEIDVPNYLNLLDLFTKLYNKSLAPDFITTTLDESNLSKLASFLLKFQKNILELESKLPTFLINDRINLNQAIISTVAEFEEIKQISTNTESIIDAEINLRIHPYLFRIIIFEFLENKRKNAKDVKASFSVKEHEQKIVLKYSQKSEFIPREESGLITIRNIVRKYFGKTTMITEGDYEFIIKFPKSLKIIL